MEWLAERKFNRYDSLWMMCYAALLSHGQWVWGFMALFAGAITSSLLEEYVRVTSPEPPK